MDPFDLERFVHAQAPVYDQVCAELRAGRKASHWMWFIFPQLAGLGRSPTAQKYALRSRAEADSYLAHPTLGPRLRECTELVNLVQGRSLGEIFGAPDDAKFRSSMTLFSRVAKDATVFEAALAKYCSSQPDPRTLELLEAP